MKPQRLVAGIEYFKNIAEIELMSKAKCIKSQPRYNTGGFLCLKFERIMVIISLSNLRHRNPS